MRGPKFRPKALFAIFASPYKIVLNRIFLIALPVLFSIGVSCTRGIESLPNELGAVQVAVPGESALKYALSATDTVKIAIDSLTTPVNWVNHFTQYKQENYLILYNKNLHSLQFYNIDKGHHTKTIMLNEEGINSIEPVSGIYFENMDSVFLTVYSPKRKFVLIDSQANIRDQWEISDTLKYDNTLYDLHTYRNFDIAYNKKNKNVTLSISPHLPSSDPRCYQYPYLIDYNIVHKNVVSNYGQFPFEPNRIYLYSELPKRLLTGSYDIVHFSGCHDLYFYDLETKRLQKIIRAKSKYLPERLKSIEPEIVIGELSEKEREYYVSEGRYDKLLKDTYRNVYYRVVKRPMECLRPDGKSKWEPDFLFSIMTLDREFQLIDELPLPADTYNPSLSTVTKNGLLISLNNTNNNEIDEDHIYFQVLSLQPKK